VKERKRKKKKEKGKGTRKGKTDHAHIGIVSQTCLTQNREVLQTKNKNSQGKERTIKGKNKERKKEQLDYRIFPSLLIHVVLDLGHLSLNSRKNGKGRKKRKKERKPENKKEKKEERRNDRCFFFLSPSSSSPSTCPLQFR